MNENSELKSQGQEENDLLEITAKLPSSCILFSYLKSLLILLRHQTMTIVNELDKMLSGISFEILQSEFKFLKRLLLLFILFRDNLMLYTKND